MKCCESLFTMLWLWIICAVCVQGLHLKGTWNPSSFYKFLAKFGFQKTDPGLLDDTQGFVYGNITSSAPGINQYTLVLVDSEYFMEFYGNQTYSSSQDTCSKMFRKIDSIAYDYPCQVHGTEDFLRKISCPKNNYCADEDNPNNVLPGYQMTYRVQNSEHPRFWYLSLVACTRNKNNPNKTCEWKPNSHKNFEISYDIWLVNGHPKSKHLNPFEHQFSFEMHDVFEIYAIFTTIYIPTLFVWLIAYRKQVHRLTKMITVCIATEFAGLFCNFLHVLIFSFNGIGAEWLKWIGNFLGTFAECLFMLVLLVIAKGWTITSMKLQSKRPVFCFWSIYTALNAVFFIVGVTKVDQITNVDEWNSWPGYLIVGFRVVVMTWFFIELRATLLQSRQETRLDFLQQFAAFYLVWFCYLPILVLIADQVSFLWRYKTIISIMYAADWLSYVVLIHLLWPSRSVLYLIKADTPLSQYELEATGLVDLDDGDDSDEIVYSAVSNQGREPYRIIKQETRLPSIPERPPRVKSSQNGRVSKGGKMKLKRLNMNSKDHGSKTNLLEDDEDEEMTSFMGGGDYKSNGGVYTSISLSDEEGGEIKKMDFEIL